MNVRELKEKLGQYDEDLEVVVYDGGDFFTIDDTYEDHDAEGNRALIIPLDELQ